VLASILNSRFNASLGWQIAPDRTAILATSAIFDYSPANIVNASAWSRLAVDFVGRAGVLETIGSGPSASSVDFIGQRTSDTQYRFAWLQDGGGLTSVVTRVATAATLPERATFGAPVILPSLGDTAQIVDYDFQSRFDGNFAIAWTVGTGAGQDLFLQTYDRVSNAPVAAPARVSQLAADTGLLWNLGDWSSTRFSLLTETRTVGGPAIQLETLLQNGTRDPVSRNYLINYSQVADIVSAAYNFANDWRAPGSDFVIISAEKLGGAPNRSQVTITSVDDRGPAEFNVIERRSFQFTANDPNVQFVSIGNGRVVFTYSDDGALKARIFDTAARSFGEAVTIAAGVDPNERGAIVNYQDGRVLITWRDISADGKTAPLLGAIWDTRTSASIFNGDDAANVFAGTALNDTLNGGGGNDRLAGGRGNDTINGGSGQDLAVFLGPRAEYASSVTGGNRVVTDQVANRDGSDTLTNIERLRFSDGTLALDIALPGQGESNAGSAYRLYEAAFNRAPDNPGLAFWIKAIDSGVSARQAAQGFVDSAEFRQVYGANPTAQQLVTGFYTNILGRAPEQAGFDFWFNILNNRPDQRAVVLEGIANSPENQNGLIGTIGQGIFVPGDLLA
jgi:Ca2+-binding RTX toxin-like protein